MFLQILIINFFNRPEQPLLIMMITAGGQLLPMTQFTNQLRTKFSYFIRKRKEVVTMENFRSLLMFGDSAGKPVEELAVLTEEVFLPLLSNPENTKWWPKVVAQDVIAHVQAFRNTVYQVRAFLVVVERGFWWYGFYCDLILELSNSCVG